MKKTITSGLLIIMSVTGWILNASAQRKVALLNHIAVYVVDLKMSTAYYWDIVQIDTIPEPFHDGKHTVGLHAQLHLIQGAKEGGVHDKNTHHCFTVPSIEDVIARLEKNKISLHQLARHRTNSYYPGGWCEANIFPGSRWLLDRNQQRQILTSRKLNNNG